jgi:amidase
MISKQVAIFAVFISCVTSTPRLYNASQLVETQTLDTPYPYEFPLLQNGTLADSGQFPMPLCHGFKLEEATIDQLQHELSKRRLTTVKLAMCYLQRILQVDEYTR